jgi:membrane protein DedA with SNARE-associated domain
LEHLLSALSKWIESVISAGNYLGIILLMGLESACIPLPSEVIMPFAGALTLGTVAAAAGSQPLNLHLVAFSGALGCALGSAVAYFVGARGGREFIFKYGKYILLRRRDVERSEAWFQRRGAVTVFVSRLLPVVRTFISLPAGIARMPFGSFLALSFLGSLPWCYLLAWIGIKVAGNIDVLKKYFHGADAVIAVGLLILFGIWLKHHLKPDPADTNA